MNAFDATCQLVDFDVSSGKPCALNQTNTSASCQKVHLHMITIHIFLLFSPLSIFTHTQLEIRLSFYASIFYLRNCFTHLFIYSNVYEQLHKYNAQPSTFSRSDGYQNFFYYPSIFFGTLLPFVVLSILNGFLIWTVRKSHKMRHTMTNTRQVLTSNAIYLCARHEKSVSSGSFAGHIAGEQSDHYINCCGHFVFCLSNTERFATSTHHSFERWHEPEQRYVWIINFPKLLLLRPKKLATNNQFCCHWY